MIWIRCYWRCVAKWNRCKFCNMNVGDKLMKYFVEAIVVTRFAKNNKRRSYAIEWCKLCNRVKEILQLNNVNFVIVEDSTRWISGKELVLLRDVESNNHNFVVALNKCIPAILAHFIPNCQDFFDFTQTRHGKEYGGLNQVRLCG